MFGLDTNVLVRLIVDDDEEQADKAQHALETKCSEESPGYVNSVVLVEVCWVLSKSYQYSNEDIANAVERLLSVKEVMVQNPLEAWEALNSSRHSKIGFADFYLSAINRAEGCVTTLTFDKRAAKTENVTQL